MVVIITDLDGCLLDPSNYDYREAIPVIREVLKIGVNLVFNSSKSRAEQEYFREKWGLNNIFVTENGAAVYIPSGNGYEIIINGISRRVIEDRIRDIIERTRNRLLWLRDMDPVKFSQIMNYPLEVSKLALVREYSTLFHPLHRDPSFIERIVYDIRSRGFNVQTGSGRVYLVTGMHDKGVATRQLRERFRGEVFIGVGDGLNDLPMLLETDYSIVLGHRELFERLRSVKSVDNIVFIDSRGPKAWLESVKIVLKRI